MPAFVEQSFKKGFILDEERLRKLREIIEKRSEPTTLSYKVYRGDSYSYTTTLIDDVVKEDNEDWRGISRLELIIDNEPQLKFTLQFSDEGCDLQATGENRDNVFLLLSDLRDYIQHEVATVTSIESQGFVATFVVLVLMLLMCVMMFSALKSPDQNAANRVLTSTDVVAKLNFLVQQSVRSKRVDKWLMAMPVTITVAIILFVSGDTILKFLLPANLFLFG